MKKLRVYVDSDVIVSSLISDTGAANFLINQKSVPLYASNYSEKEIKNVAGRLDLEIAKINGLFKNKLEIVHLGGGLDKTKKDFNDYVTDKNDAHVVAGAVKAKAQFLISYNLRHYKADKIKTDFKMLLMTPAMFLQYLRSK